MNKIFKLFSLIFSYPTKETIEEIKKLSKNVLSSKAQEVLNKTKLEDLQVEYTKLFINSYPTLLCPPYESYYREGVVYGNTMIEVREFYEKHGLRYKYKSEPPDHISVELEFLAITENKQFEKRLKEWVFKFTERVKKHSKIYNIFAEELENFLRKE